MQEYVAGTNLAIKKEIDNLITNNRNLTSKLCIKLFDKYIALFDNKKLAKMRLDTRRILTDILKALIKVDDHTTKYGDSLVEYGARLDIDMGVEDLQSIIKEIISETRSVQDSYTSLKKQFKESKHEMENLRKDLEIARNEAFTDPLTGLVNRKGLTKSWKKAIDDNTTVEKNLCLLMIDIDHFKKINDNFGHPVGDMVLKMMGTIIKRSVKGMDTASRFGGEEFAILLPDTPLDKAYLVAENIRKTIANHTIKHTHKQETVGNITVSIGVACYRADESFNSFIKRADSALYTSKNQGRNRVSVDQ